MRATILTCIIRRTPFLPSLDAALQVWACALKGQLSQVIKEVSSMWGLRLVRGFCSSISCHWSLDTQTLFLKE